MKNDFETFKKAYWKKNININIDLENIKKK